MLWPLKGLITYLYRGYNPVTKYNGHPSRGWCYPVGIYYKPCIRIRSLTNQDFTESKVLRCFSLFAHLFSINSSAWLGLVKVGNILNPQTTHPPGSRKFPMFQSGAETAPAEVEAVTFSFRKKRLDSSCGVDGLFFGSRKKDIEKHIKENYVSYLGTIVYFKFGWLRYKHLL